jgi:hypothetical protein
VTLRQRSSIDNYYFIIGGKPLLHLLSSCCGGHVKIGPPSGAGTCGTAATTYVPTNPNIRMEILIACFMGFLLPRLGFQKEASLTR